MKNKKLLIYRIVFVLWTMIIITLTSLPKLRTPAAGIIGFDKLAHFSVYLVFAFLYVKMYQKSTKQLLKSLLLLALIIPFADEIHQIPIPGREFSIYDVIADMLGFSIILLLAAKRILKPVGN